MPNIETPALPPALLALMPADSRTAILNQVPPSLTGEVPQDMVYIERGGLSLGGFLLFYGPQRYLVINSDLDTAQKRQGIRYLRACLETDNRECGLHFWRITRPAAELNTERNKSAQLTRKRKPVRLAANAPQRLMAAYRRCGPSHS